MYSTALRLKARLLKAGAIEALSYGCMTRAPRNAHYRQLRTTHHKLLLRVIGYRRVHGSYRKMPYAKALKKTGSQSMEATIRQRRLLFVGALTRQGDKRLPKGLLFAGRLEGGEDPGPASQHSTGRKARGTTSKHSELYRASRQLIAGLSESTGLSGPMRCPRRRECRDTQGFCWRRRGLWRRGTRAKKKLLIAGYAR